jgi:choline kinase
MKAVLLAAGVGRRLKPYTDDRPKCLVEIGGVSLLHRHLDILTQVPEIDGVDIVVGYRHDMIRDAIAIWSDKNNTPFPVRFYLNEAFREGSIVSFYSARDTVSSHDTVIMDADVLYPTAVIKRLIHSNHTNCFLLDDSTEESGEEMMVCCRGERAMHIARSHDPSTQTGWDLRGEGVGFFRLAKKDSHRLLEIMESDIGNGHRNADYETALAQFMKICACGYESIGDLPWTEIDFSEDIVHAENTVLPAIQAYQQAE